MLHLKINLNLYFPPVLSLRSLSGSVGSSSLSSAASESSHKTPVKRVSFSATNSIINGDTGEQIVKHRDSIISASTDSSEDSNSSGGSFGSEGRLGASFRGKMRPKLPLSTDTTRNLAEMCNVPTVEEGPEAIYAESPYSKGNQHCRTGSSSSVASAGFTRNDRRRASMQERRGSLSSAGSDNSHRLSQPQTRAPPMSPVMKQHSMDSVANGKQNTNCQGHVRRRSDSLVGSVVDQGNSESPTNNAHYGTAPNSNSSPLYSTVYSSVTEELRRSNLNNGTTYADNVPEPEPLYNQIRSPTSTIKHRPKKSSLPPPPEHWDEMNGHEGSPPPLPPPIDSMQMLPPPPPTNNQESLYTTAQAMRSPPPPTAPKPLNGHSNPLPPPPPSCNSLPPPPPTMMSQQSLPPPAVANNTAAANQLYHSSPPSANPTAYATPQSTPATAQSPRQPPPAPSLATQKQPPPPPLRIPSHDSVNQSSPSSANSSPLHVPMPPPMPPITPKLPPPTLPKSTVMAPPPGVIMSNMSSPPPPPSVTQHQAKNVGQNGVYENPKGKNLHNGMSNNTSSLPHSIRQSGVSSEDFSGPPQSPSLPFLSELSKRTNPDNAGNKCPVDLRNGQSPMSPNAQHHRRSASAGGVNKGGRAPPPPPPKRNEATRLSASDNPSSPNTPISPTAVDPNNQNGLASPLIANPIYENFDGIMDIDELPPPPPELLVGLPQSDPESHRTSASGKKPKPPPPPPKRSRDTQLLNC